MSKYEKANLNANKIDIKNVHLKVGIVDKM